MAIALTGLRLWDGLASEARGGFTLRIEGTRIAGVGTDPALTREADIVALEGGFAMPGLIDAHVHMTLDPSIGPPAEQLSVSSEVLERAMSERALAMLQAGITTARDLGGGEWRELRLRDRIARGELRGPRLLCAGQPITSPAGHCHFWGGGAANAQAIRATVARQREHGVDWIKIMATGGVMTRGSSAREAQFDADEIRAAVDEAAASGLSVAAHCHATAGIRNAVLAGVRTVEHCSWVGESGFGGDLDRSVIREMAKRGTWISGTVNPGWGRRILKDGRLTDYALRMKTCFGAARALGVRIIAATDAGIPGVGHTSIAPALPIFAEYTGYSNLEALRAATSESARALGIAGETGSLRVGLAADVLVVDGDPLQDLTLLTRPRAVFARGRRVELA